MASKTTQTEERITVSSHQYSALADLSARPTGYATDCFSLHEVRRALVRRGLAEFVKDGKDTLIRITSLGKSALTVLHALAEQRSRGNHRPYTVYINTATQTADYRRANKSDEEQN